MVRHVNIVPGAEAPLHSPLSMRLAGFSESELQKVLQKMKNGKATKPNDIPAEVFKALSKEPGQLQWLIDFCNECWVQKTLPDEWLVAMVTLIYKKGDPGNCDNYRPICLLSIAMKAFSAMLKQGRGCVAGAYHAVAEKPRTLAPLAIVHFMALHWQLWDTVPVGSNAAWCV